MAQIENDAEVRTGVTSILISNGGNQQMTADLKSLMWLKDAQLDIRGMEDEDMPEWVQEGAEVILNVMWPTKGIVVFKGLITYVLRNRVHVGHLIYDSTIQRRNDVKVSFTGTGFLAEPGEQFGLQVSFKNISAGGLGFTVPDTTTGRRLTPGHSYRISFSMNGTDVYESTILLLRAEPDPLEEEIHCGAQFINFKGSTEAEFRSAIFAQQREDTRLERELSRQGLVQIDMMMNATEKDYEEFEALSRKMGLSPEGSGDSEGGGDDEKKLSDAERLKNVLQRIRRR